MKNRKHSLKYNVIYKKFECLNYEDRYRCYYCNEPAATMDHQPPITQVGTVIDVDESFECVLVPCCRECNSLLGATVTTTLEDRMVVVKNKLEKKYKKYINIIEQWKEEEILELGESLRSSVIASINLAKISLNRLAYKGHEVTEECQEVEYCSFCKEKTSSVHHKKYCSNYSQEIS
jgi:hypothetical protein